MSEWRDFCEGLDDSDRLLAEVWQFLDSGRPFEEFVGDTNESRRAYFKRLIAEHLGIK